MIGGATTGAVKEDTVVNAQGTLTVIDPDAGQSVFRATVLQGVYGSFTLDESGVWSYALANRQLNVQSLNGDVAFVDAFTVHAADGTPFVLMLSVRGVPDEMAPSVATSLNAVISPTAAQSAASANGGDTEPVVLQTNGTDTSRFGIFTQQTSVFSTQFDTDSGESGLRVGGSSKTGSNVPLPVVTPLTAGGRLFFESAGGRVSTDLNSRQISTIVVQSDLEKIISPFEGNISVPSTLMTIDLSGGVLNGAGVSDEPNLDARQSSRSGAGASDQPRVQIRPAATEKDPSIVLPADRSDTQETGPSVGSTDAKVVAPTMPRSDESGKGVEQVPVVPSKLKQPDSPKPVDNQPLTQNGLLGSALVGALVAANGQRGRIVWGDTKLGRESSSSPSRSGARREINWAHESGSCGTSEGAGKTVTKCDAVSLVSG